jgi:ERCC4-related helicase
MTLGAGQGKTIVYILVAMILNKHDPKTYDRFLFLTTSKALVKQLEYILVNHSTIDI